LNKNRILEQENIWCWFNITMKL